MTTQPSDWAVRAAFLELTEAPTYEVLNTYFREDVLKRARELDASGGGEPVAWQRRSRYWDGAPWGEWQTFNSESARSESLAPYADSEWQHELRELYATPRAAEAGD